MRVVALAGGSLITACACGPATAEPRLPPPPPAPLPAGLPPDFSLAPKFGIATAGRALGHQRGSTKPVSAPTTEAEAGAASPTAAPPAPRPAGDSTSAAVWSDTSASAADSRSGSSSAAASHPAAAAASTDAGCLAGCQQQQQRLDHSPAPLSPGVAEEAALLLERAEEDSFSIPAVRGASGRESGGGTVNTLWRRALQSRRLSAVLPTAPSKHPQRQQQQQPTKKHGTGAGKSGSVSECAVDVQPRAALAAPLPAPVVRRRTRAVVTAAARPSADENEPWLLLR